MESLIHISGLTIGYNKCTVVKNMTTSFNSGELICIIGRNGEGKSTLIKTLCRLIPPISGSISVKNNDLFKLADKDFANLISVVLTSKITITNISVKEFVAFGRYPYTNWLGKLTEEDEIQVETAVEMCGINSLTNRDFSSLSDGEKQKVNIARAIAQNTPIIILDEPTAHLDLVNNMEIFKLLKVLANDYNKTIIFSTHYIELALQLADKICLVNNESCHCDTPKNTVDSKKIDQLFDKKTVKYNAVNNSFEFIF
ncbi:MAG: ABC transporter ATP-binding protein [Bacteroidetes bacterium]|nr:ABC transporter ATP-binding protein [Bacteroidota bacterium]